MSLRDWRYLGGGDRCGAGSDPGVGARHLAGLKLALHVMVLSSKAWTVVVHTKGYGVGIVGVGRWDVRG